MGNSGNGSRRSTGSRTFQRWLLNMKGDYWGKASDTAFEDTLHNEMYFDQFLARFASLISEFLQIFGKT